MKALLEHLYFLAQYLSEAELETIVAIVLIDLGFPAGRMPFEYLKKAIILFKKNPNQLLAYELYPDVAKMFAMTSRMQVEIAIRREVHRAWKNRFEDKWYPYFPNGLTLRDTGPSNAEFIYGMIQVLEIWEGCRDNYRKKAGAQNEEK